jgi:hypothetical protein
MMVEADDLAPGVRAVLVELPAGVSTRGLPLAVGREYTVRYLDGNNACITTDDPGLEAHVHARRLRVVAPAREGRHAP